MHYFLKKMNLIPNVVIITDLNPLIIFLVTILTKGLFINHIKQVLKSNKLKI
jgi:hypothetical protein